MIAAHPTPRTDRAEGKGRIRGVQRGEHMVLRDVQAPDVVQIAVVALEDDGVHGAFGAADLVVAREHIAHAGRKGRADRERIGQDQRRLEIPELLHLHESRALAEAVDHMDRGGAAVMEQIPLVRQQGCHARLHIAIRQRAVPDRDPRHVGDEVAFAFLLYAEAGIHLFIRLSARFSFMIRAAQRNVNAGRMQKTAALPGRSLCVFMPASYRGWPGAGAGCGAGRRTARPRPGAGRSASDSRPRPARRRCRHGSPPDAHCAPFP